MLKPGSRGPKLFDCVGRKPSGFGKCLRRKAQNEKRNGQQTGRESKPQAGTHDDALCGGISGFDRFGKHARHQDAQRDDARQDIAGEFRLRQGKEHDHDESPDDKQLVGAAQSGTLAQSDAHRFRQQDAP